MHKICSKSESRGKYESLKNYLKYSSQNQMTLFQTKQNFETSLKENTFFTSWIF